MKHLIYIFLLFCLWGTLFCEYQDQNDPLKDVEVEEIHDYDFENDIQISSVKEALDYVASNMTYKNEENDYWQLPKQSYQWKTGDCEDYCILLLYLTWTILNIDDSFLVIIKIKEDIGIGYPVWVSDHAIVQINGVYYEPQTRDEIPSPIEEDVLLKYSYPEVIWKIMN